MWSSVQHVQDKGGTIFFAPGVGPVQWWFGLGFNGDLHNALIGGTIITAIEKSVPAVPKSKQITGFPNPFRSEYSFSISTSHRQSEEALVYDLLGRQVDQLSPFDCNRRVCRYVWKPQRLPSGLYLIVVRTGDQQFHTTVLLSK